MNSKFFSELDRTTKICMLAFAAFLATMVFVFALSGEKKDARVDEILFEQDVAIYDTDSNLMATIKLSDLPGGRDSVEVLNSKLDSVATLIAIEFAEGRRGLRYYNIENVTRWGAFVAGEATVHGASTRSDAKTELEKHCKTASKNLLGQVQWGDFKACVDMHEISPYADTVHTLCGVDSLVLRKGVWWNYSPIIGDRGCRNAPIHEVWRE